VHGAESRRRHIGQADRLEGQANRVAVEVADAQDVAVVEVGAL